MMHDKPGVIVVDLSQLDLQQLQKELEDGFDQAPLVFKTERLAVFAQGYRASEETGTIVVDLKSSQAFLTEADLNQIKNDLMVAFAAAPLAFNTERLAVFAFDYTYNKR